MELCRRFSASSWWTWIRARTSSKVFTIFLLFERLPVVPNSERMVSGYIIACAFCADQWTFQSIKARCELSQLFALVKQRSFWLILCAVIRLISLFWNKQGTDCYSKLPESTESKSIMSLLYCYLFARESYLWSRVIFLSKHNVSAIIIITVIRTSVYLMTTKS